MLESPEKIASILRSCGLNLPLQQFKAQGGRFRIVANFDIPSGSSWADLTEFLQQPDDFSTI
jgi:hypothetical protein